MSETFKILDEKNGSSSCSTKPSLNVVQNYSGRQPAAVYQGKAVLVTLGCAKNQVDSEVMLGVLRNRGFEIVKNVADADVAIVNTCGFLQSSVKESIDCVLEIAEHKKTGRLRRLVVAGCMIERYNGSIQEELPEVDAFIGVNEILKIDNAARLDQAEFQQKDFLTEAARPYFLYDDNSPRQLDSVPHSAWIKVSEGCNRPCTFCIIPKIRGSMRSREMESIIRETAELVSQGVKEINLVAQDSTDFGQDYGGSGERPSMAQLLRALDQKTRIKWIRLLYAYPLGINVELLRAITESPAVCNYIDVPFQHSAERLLREMKRPLGRFTPRGVVELIKNEAPEIAIRTTFIVGFPGETEEDLLNLEKFIRESEFSSVGIFTYSREESTPSFDLPKQISEKEKEARRSHIMLAQQEVQAEKLHSLIGKTFEVLVDGYHDETELLYLGRTRFRAPEVDGAVLINEINPELGKIEAGSLYKVKITEVAGYDLVGRIESE